MDKIEIINNLGQKEDMEIVMTYEYNKYNYIIYKDDINNYYIAKKDEYGNLDSNLNSDEINYGEKVLKEVINEITSK